MDGVSPSSETSHDQWLTLSLSTVPQPQSPPQPRPQPQLLPLLQAQPQPRPLFPAPFHYIPLVAPVRPFSPPQEQEPHQERYFVVAPPFPSPPFQVHDLPESRLLPRCDFPSQQDQDQEAGQTRQARARKLPAMARRKRKTETIEPPFPWATTTRATVYSLEHLLAQNIKSISGTVKCVGCHEQYDIEFDLEENFHDVARFVAMNKSKMHDRAPDAWTVPVLPTCKLCGQENSLRPVIAKKRNTNWLFLLLGQMIGCCTLSHLKYFCRHTKNHSTAAKNRLIYLTYLGLCKQLQPEGPFDP